MKERKRIILNFMRVFALCILLLLVALIVFMVVRNPEVANSEYIAKCISDNTIIAVIEFMLLYLLKGISMVFPSAAINISVGMIWEFPKSILVSSLGILVEFITLFFVGKLLGADFVREMHSKYKILHQIDEYLADNSLFVCFALRITGVLSYDVVSLYLGAMNVKISYFVIGSMSGAILNIILDGLIADFILYNNAVKLLLIIVFRIFLLGISYGIKVLSKRLRTKIK